MCFIVLSVTVCTVGYVCLFCGDQIFVYFVSFLSMIIYEVLYTWYLRHNMHLQCLVFRYKNIKLLCNAGNRCVQHKTNTWKGIAYPWHCYYHSIVAVRQFTFGRGFQGCLENLKSIYPKNCKINQLAILLTTCFTS